MDRRTKARLDLQLLCRIGADKVLSSPLGALTENMSREGMLLRWIEAVPLPGTGCKLTVDVDLPENEGIGRRVMRCRTTVVRIVREGDGPPSVGLHIHSVRFVQAKASAGGFDLGSMPPATDRVV